jgi:hypothetical protein
LDLPCLSPNEHNGVNKERKTVVAAMPKNQETDEMTMLQVRVRASIRDRLKLQSVLYRESMGDLADRLLDEALEQLEKSSTKRK